MKAHGKLLQVVYQGHTINFATEYKHPGTVIDSHLTLNDNFDKAYKKASSRLRLLHRLRLCLTFEAARKIYAMMIVPLITSSTTHTIHIQYHTHTHNTINLNRCLDLRL